MSSHITTPYDKRRVSRFLTHLICLCLLFFLPEVMMTLGSPRRAEMPMWFFYLKPLFYCVAFYLNYYVIIDRSLGRRYGMWRFAGWNALLIVVLLTALMFLSHRCFPHRPPEDGFNIPRALGFMLRDGVFMVLTISLAVALKMSDKWLNLDRKQQSLQMTRREEELKNLKSQLNPHFLFNTLNSIYALISISPARAQEAVHDLSGMLRYVLYEDRPEVSLSEELNFIDNYIRLMMLRIGDRARVSVTLDAADGGDTRIAPMLFISPVENAFKHGNTGERDSRIEISITWRDGVVTCYTSNSYRSSAQSTDHAGIGMSNLRRRLHLIYGDRATLNTDISDGHYNMTMTINLNTPKR